ncbi:syndecan-4 isoform X1 [Trachemys scripta elegans]|uniref:syndecan-4 isoform X1 n=1 Tax=Trachemys scripta elegans TaxID=31138 RepID=UPI001551AD77|nr:syndecan-4 isoform X1 [Trachemys scripta elegans]
MQLLSARHPGALCAALLLLVAASAVSAESVRETETMDPERYGEDYFSSGALPDDEDISDLRPDLTEESDWFSGSGDDDDDAEDDMTSTTEESPMLSSDNYIPEDPGKGTKDVDENLVVENELTPRKVLPPEELNPSNKISMASTANSSLFERTEVLAALIAGGAVGLLFAVFLILLLVYRMKKKDEGSYDLGKKPIYKKAPTNEFYA